jgi:predicted branched-subunit amino acid permease
MERRPKSPIARGLGDGLPLLLVAIPFALLFGFTINAAVPVVQKGVAWSSNLIVFAGASQIAMTDLLGAGGTVGLAIIVGLVINARHLMYSAALARRFVDQPRWFKMVGPIWLLDHLFALVSTQTTGFDAKDFRRYWLAVSALFYVFWPVFVTVGVFLGPIIPEEWPVEFALPAMFISIVVPSIQSKPALVAAVVGGLVGATASGLPLGIGLLIGGVLGIVAGTVVEGQANA